MKINKCPYCGKRISYISSYASRRKGEFVCERCGKESKVTINKTVILFFVFAVVISIAIMMIWIFAGLLNNPLGILFVAVPLIIFVLITPKFVYYEPLKKYKKSMEARKAGIAYSDNLITSEIDEINTYSFPSITNDSAGEFQINSDIFNKIKEERNAARERLKDNEILSDSSKIKDKENKNYVSIIDNVTENHISSDAPLKRLRTENSSDAVRRNHHYVCVNEDDNNSGFSSESKKNDGNRYSSNRRF